VSKISAAAEIRISVEMVAEMRAMERLCRDWSERDDLARLEEIREEEVKQGFADHQR